jgi:hypothetical protein
VEVALSRTDRLDYRMDGHYNLFADTPKKTSVNVSEYIIVCMTLQEAQKLSACIALLSVLCAFSRICQIARLRET